MAFQNQVYINQALGKPGTIARLNPIDKIPVVAEGTAVAAGGFVFEGTDPEVQVIGPSSATSSKTAADIAGVFVFEKYQLMLRSVSDMNSLVVNEGEEGAKVRKGYVYVTPTTASVHGQSVFLNPSTGEIQTAASAPESFIATGWTVETGNAANQPCEIYKI